MKYIMIAKCYLAYHPRAGEPTGFRDSIISGRKRHTLRNTAGGLRDGDRVSLREWSGAPYRSAQVEFARCTVGLGGINMPRLSEAYLAIVAEMDGFDNIQDFADWFGGFKNGRIDWSGVCIWFQDLEVIA